MEGRRTGRPPGADLQRPLQQPRPAPFRRVASDHSRRVQRHQLLRPPEAGHLADRRLRHDLCRPRGRRGQNLQPRRRDHGAEAARPHHQGDDGRSRPLPRPGEPRVPPALSDRPNPGRRRDQFRQGQAPAVSRPGGDRPMGLHHHHPFGLQVHTLPGRFRARADHAADAILFGSARAHRRGRPALAQAHRADEGGSGGGPRAAQVAARTTC